MTTPRVENDQAITLSPASFRAPGAGPFLTADGAELARIDLAGQGHEDVGTQIDRTTARAVFMHFARAHTVTNDEHAAAEDAVEGSIPGEGRRCSLGRDNERVRSKQNGTRYPNAL